MRKTTLTTGVVHFLLLAALLSVPAGPAAAQSGDELFADGNRLYQDDLYWAALLRYRQAEEAGLRTPLLDYNIGVAHYRAKQYSRARAAFARAAENPGMRYLAQYNLGLTAMADGDDDTALQWFRQVNEQSSRPQLAALAGRAMERIRDGEYEATIADEPSRLFDVQLPTGLQLIATVGVGSDDNAYRSPDQAYNDQSQAGNPLITPVVQSGVYYPVDFTARYSVGSFDNEAFFASYRAAGRYYQDPLLENAGEWSHQLAFGSRFHRRSENRERKIYSAFTVAKHDETWFDPDDGSERISNGELAGERFSYVRYGPELWARQSFSRLSFGLHGKGQIWNYERTGDLPEYDHEYLTAGVSAQYRFTSTSLLRIEGDLSSRRFGDRRSYDLDGGQRIDNPTVRYDYVNYGASARQRVTRHFWFGLRYARTERTDKYVGYNDYLRDSYGAEFSLRISDRFKLRGIAWYRNYNYVRAHAYNSPPAGRKTLETADARVTLRWLLTDNLSAVGRFDYRDTASTDLRVDYTRSQYMLGVEWRQ